MTSPANREIVLVDCPDAVGLIHRITGVLQFDKIDALDHAAGSNVETGNDAFGEAHKKRSPQRTPESQGTAALPEHSVPSVSSVAQSFLLNLSASFWASPKFSVP